MIEPPVRGQGKQNSNIDSPERQVILYRVLDESLVNRAGATGLQETLKALLANESNQSGIKRFWIVGLFAYENDRSFVIDSLNARNAGWIDGGREADKGFFDECGVFIPDARLLKLIDQKVEGRSGWMMLWPWYCNLPTAAERDILIDLGRADSSRHCETLLRIPAPTMDASTAVEPQLSWCEKTLPILPYGLKSPSSDFISSMTEGNQGYRAGWALNVQDISDYRSVNALKNSSTHHRNHPEFHFGICLRSRFCTHNWPLVCQNLERTLYNLSRQRCCNFKVWIAIHEQPDVNTYGLNVEFVVADFNPPVNPDGTFGNDKRRKRNAIGHALAKNVHGGFYYMQLDADDLIDTSLVQAVYADDNRAGYLIESGYIFDYTHGVAARCNQQSVPFWKQCGSSAVLYFESEDIVKNKSGKSYFELQQRHELFAENARLHGRELTLWKDDMALYLINHGENDWSSYRHESNERRGSSKSRFVYRHQMHASDMHALFLRYPELASASIKNKEVKLTQGTH